MKTDSRPAGDSEVFENPADVYWGGRGGIRWAGKGPGVGRSPSKPPDGRRAFTSSQAESCCHVLDQHTLHTHTHLSTPLTTSAHTLDGPRLTYKHSFVLFCFLEVGRMGSKAAGSPEEFSLWFLSLKEGSASGLGAGRRSPRTGGPARGKGVSGA